jgi:hypothetical protein
MERCARVFRVEIFLQPVIAPRKLTGDSGELFAEQFFHGQLL